MKTPRIVSLDHEKQSYLHYNTKQKKNWWGFLVFTVLRVVEKICPVFIFAEKKLVNPAQFINQNTEKRG